MLAGESESKPGVPTHRSIVMSTAGRRFAPNMLYDATTDQLVPGFTLSDQPDIQKDIHPSSSMVYSTDESFKEKSDKLEITGSLKLSVLCGLVKLEGSGKYLTEAQKSDNKERVALYFKGQTRVEKLHIPSTFKDEDHRICRLRKHATHVVTSVTYGGNAVCLFESDASSSVDKTEWSGKGNMAFDETVKALTSFLLNVSGEAKADHSAKENETLKKIHFSCFGDFYSDKVIPNNAADAQDFMRGLPALIKKESVPVTATLLPLEAIGCGKMDDACPHFRTGKIVSNIETGLLDDVCEYFEKLAEVQLVARGLLQHCHVFIQLEDQVRRFLGAVEKYRRKKLAELAELLPKIRQGQESHTKLSEMLFEAWNPDALFSWMKKQKQECNQLKSCVEILKKCGAHFLSDETEDIYRRLLEIKNPVLHIKLPAHGGVKFVEGLENSLNNGQCSNMQVPVRDEQGSSQEHLGFADIAAALRRLRSFLERNSETLEEGSLYVTVTSISALQVFVISPNSQEPAEFEEPIAPFVVSAEPAGIHSIKLQWDEVTNKAIRAVKIEYQEVNSEEDENSGGGSWQQNVETKAVERPANAMQGVIESLKSGTRYNFRLWASTDFGLSTNPSEAVHVSTLTPKRCAIFIRDHYSRATFVKTNKAMGGAEQYQSDHRTGFPGKVFDLKKRLLRPRVPPNTEVIPSYEVGPGLGMDPVSPKVVLVIGETGTGKTTLLDGIANIYYGVDFADNFRFKLVDENDPKACKWKKNQESITRRITIYTLNPVSESGEAGSGSIVDYPLVLIDTPGFGDTAGLKKDQDTVTNISNMLRGEAKAPGLNGALHGICFVVKASQTRLTESQKYVFDQVQSLFGKDTKDAFFQMITFADSEDPQVLGSLKKEKIPGKPFCVNNAMLFADNGMISEDSSAETSSESSIVEKAKKKRALQRTTLQWEDGSVAYAEFFHTLSTSLGVALEETQKVLSHRLILENSALSARKRVEQGLTEARNIRNLIPFIKSLSAQISDHEQNMTTTVTKLVYNQVDIKPEECVTICMSCQDTCHYPCNLPQDADKEGCSAMTLHDRQHCGVCKDKCHWSQHHNSPFRIITEEIEEKITVKELFQKFKVKSSERENNMNLICGMLQRHEEIRRNLLRDFFTIQGCLKTLQERALLQYPFSVVDHIDKMIFNLEQRQPDGWKEQVESLTDAKKQAELIVKWSKQEDVEAGLEELLSEVPLPLIEISEIEAEIKQMKGGRSSSTGLFSSMCRRACERTTDWLKNNRKLFRRHN